MMDEFRLCRLDDRIERGGFYLRYEFYTTEAPLPELSRGGAFNVTTKEESSEPCGGRYVCKLCSVDLTCFFALPSKSSLAILNSFTI